MSDRTPVYMLDPAGATDGDTPRFDAVLGRAAWGPGGGVQSIVPGTGIAVDSTDPANPVIHATGGGGSSSMLLVRDGVSPLEPVGSDADSTVWLYSDPSSGAGAGGVTDHGALTGLADDDHPQYVKGQSGRSYRMIAGVLRKDAGSWFLLNNASHAPLGLGTVTASSSNVTITFNPAATRVASLVVTPDETHAASYLVGASVGVSSFYLNFYDLAGNPLNPLTMPDSTAGNFWILGIMEAS